MGFIIEFLILLNVWTFRVSSLCRDLSSNSYLHVTEALNLSLHGFYTKTTSTSLSSKTKHFPFVVFSWKELRYYELSCLLVWLSILFLLFLAIIIIRRIIIIYLFIHHFLITCALFLKLYFIQNLKVFVVNISHINFDDHINNVSEVC